MLGNNPEIIVLDFCCFKHVHRPLLQIVVRHRPSTLRETLLLHRHHRVGLPSLATRSRPEPPRLGSRNIWPGTWSREILPWCWGPAKHWSRGILSGVWSLVTPRLH